ncbi:MAG: 50S ribosomal protein L20 [Clostridiales bacterium]|nr:50S ribosomal protein L20 [Clostridiales bacterium]
MARIKGALNARKKHKKILKLAKGYRGARSKEYRVAKQSVMKAMAYAFAGRKQTKREYRSLWITRINAAARANDISYSKLMHGLKEAGVTINRKMLADLAISDAAGFTKLVETAKSKLN